MSPRRAGFRFKTSGRGQLVLSTRQLATLVKAGMPLLRALRTVADQLDPRAYVAASQRAADRAGLLACGDVMVAIQLAGGPRAASHLVHLAASRRYLTVRKKLRARP